MPRWVRTPVAALGSALGAIAGTLLGAYFADFGGAIAGCGLGAICGDVLALVSIGIIVTLLRGEGYLVALTVPCVGVYLGVWVLAGLLAGVSSIAAGVVVVLLMVVPVLAVVAARLFRDFRDDALALVLERRFPEVLGDRLITAVELANPKKAAEFGYSEVMIEQTIHDAAERVQTVPVREVFDWGRLYRYWGGVAVVTLGLYLVAGGLFSIPFIGETSRGGARRLRGLPPGGRAGPGTQRPVAKHHLAAPGFPRSARLAREGGEKDRQGRFGPRHQGPRLQVGGG